MMDICLSAHPCRRPSRALPWRGVVRVCCGAAHVAGRDGGAVQVDGRPERAAQLPARRGHAVAQRLLHRYARRGFSCARADAAGAEFELGLELDSAEVRGVLIFEGQDWGHVVFDFRA